VTGAAAIAIEGTPALLGVLLLLFGAVSIARKGSGWIMVTIGFIVTALMGSRFAVQAYNQHVLRNLQPASIASLTVGTCEVNEELAVEKIGESLRRVQWYTPGKGESAPVPFVLTMKDGARYFYRLGKSKEGGVMIEFSTKVGSGGRFFFGYGYSASLRTAVEGAGVPQNARCD
jgi:hypothetical protein